MMHKAWHRTEEVPYCFSRASIQFHDHTDQKIENLKPIWIRLLGQSQLSNPSDLPCYFTNIYIPVFVINAWEKWNRIHAHKWRITHVLVILDWIDIFKDGRRPPSCIKKDFTNTLRDSSNLDSTSTFVFQLSNQCAWNEWPFYLFYWRHFEFDMSFNRHQLLKITPGGESTPHIINKSYVTHDPVLFPNI